MSFMKKNAVRALLAGSALSLVAFRASAQDASAGQERVLDEIVVTAQKRTERLMDVPLSITAVSGDQLNKQGITDARQLTKLVPGFTYQESNYGTPIFTIRGIGFLDGSIAAEPTVTAYVDQVPLPYSILTRGASLDLERVEVLKGPQGTLFGQNSTGGAINYIAAKPTSTFAAGATVSYGRFNSTEAEGFVSGPLTDTLRARLAVRGEYADGWQKSITRPGDTFGDKRFYNARLLLDWKPTDALSFELNVTGWQDKSQVQAGQLQQFAPQQPVNPFTQFVYNALSTAPIRLDGARWADWTPGTGRKHNNYYLVSLRGDWRISDDLTLTSITSFQKLVVRQPFDPDGAAFDNFRNVVHDGLVKSLSQEIRLDGSTERLKWMLGGNYQHNVANEATVLADDATNGVVPTPTGPVYQDKSAYIWNQQPTTKAIFGSVDYKLTNQLTLQLSARYTEHTNDFNGCIRDAGAGNFGVSTATAFLGLSELLSGTPSTVGPHDCLTLNDVTFKPELAVRKLDEHNTSWRTSLNWKPTLDSLLYFNAVKGYKAGAFETAPGVLASEFDPITQESVLSLEGGAKYSWRQRLEISGAVYHYEYNNKQLVGVATYPIFGNLPKLVNIPKSRVWGAELELTARPIDQLRLQAGVSYVASKVLKDPQVPLDPYGNVVSYVGEEFPNTPRWQFTSDAEYDFPLSGGALGFVGGSLSYRSKSNAAFGERPEFALRGYALLDLRAGVEWDKWRAQIWGRNINNKYYWVNVSHILDTVARFSGAPATYGMTLSYRY